MSTSGLSDLSSPLSTDDELASAPIRPGSLDAYFKHAGAAKPDSPPAKKKRAPSPPHEYVLADNADIAFIVMFRSRFSDAFPKSLSHYGPQDIERGVEGSLPDEQIERLLCALLGLVLNRKKDVERGHFQRALEEAVQTHASQWPAPWAAKNPLHGGGNFNNMNPGQRLTLLKALIIWSLGSSEAIQAIIKESYKQQRHDDDLNQPLSVQAWGRDGDKRRFWLIEGQDDTHFRLYRESNPALKTSTWRSVAGSIDELKNVAAKLGEENTQASRRLHDRIMNAIPRFEASEDKRKRRDYRLNRKAQFTRPELGFSLYEGRTRGKRMKYTFSDEEEGLSDAQSTRRSIRNSGVSTPAEPAGPTFTASGRRVRSRHGGAYGEAMLSGQQDEQGAPRNRSYDAIGDDEGKEEEAHIGVRTRGGLSRNSAGQSLRSRARIDQYNDIDGMDEESDATSSGEEWDGGDDDDEVDDHGGDGDEEDTNMSDDNASDGPEEVDTNATNQDRDSLVVSLRYRPKKPQPLDAATPASDFLQPTDNDTTSRTFLNLCAPQSIKVVPDDLKHRQHPLALPDAPLKTDPSHMSGVPHTSPQPDQVYSLPSTNGTTT